MILCQEEMELVLQGRVPEQEEASAEVEEEEGWEDPISVLEEIVCVLHAGSRQNIR